MRLFVGLLLLLVSSAGYTADIAFGSSIHQWNKQPVWKAIRDTKPALFIFAGDNVHTDLGPFILLRLPYRIGKAYEQLADDKGFAELREQIPILATWNDHDYGRADAGEEFRHKEASKQHFMRFFDVPESAPMRNRPGIYAAHNRLVDGVQTQILLLDTRSFRSPLYLKPANKDCPHTHPAPDTDETATLLGDEQWEWLEQQLEQPAQLRIVVSSIQVIPEQHCFEKWSNFPHERQLLLESLQDAKGQVVIISGDRRLGEISHYSQDNAPAIYEVTASGMNSAGAGLGEVNRHRLFTDNVRLDHFGLIRVNNGAEGAALSLQLRDTEGRVLQHYEIPQKINQTQQ